MGQQMPAQATFDKMREYFGFAETRTPDALRVPQSWKGTSTNKFKRAATLFDVTEPLLGVGHGGAYARNQGHMNEFFITRSPYCTLLFPVDHPTHAKTPRYEWRPISECGPGVWFGYLKPECKELDGQFDPEVRRRLEEEQQRAWQAKVDRWHRIDDQPVEQRSPDDTAFYERYREFFEDRPAPTEGN